ncbi:MAG: IS1380 family transposase [Actinomycetota bacterium]|nr:IS1380 family transposase [Actinomycetota bacterium]
MVNEPAVVVAPDRVVVVFDEGRLVADAGVVLPAALAGRLGVEALVDEAVDLGDRAGAANAGAKVMTLVSAMALGADSIDDCDILRSGSTAAVLGHRVAAPSTLGTFLRAFTFGHVRQLDRVLGESIERAWRAGAGPGKQRLVCDVDSFVGEVHGYHKQGAAFGYTRQRGYHPLLASRSDTGEVLHIRLRKGSANTARGALRFIEELIARVERAGASGEKLLRADSGFWSKQVFGRLERAGWRYSVGVRLQPHVRAAIEQIPDHAWQTLADYPPTSEAQIAETVLAGRRLIVRRVRTLDAQGELLPSWEHYPFLTNRTDALEAVESEHRQHAVVELCIRDLKDQALAHFPSGQFFANAAWTVISALAHNLLRWTGVLGLPGETVRTARTLRRQLLSLPGRLTRTARRWTLHLPARWPWQHAFIEALTRIRGLPALT